MRAVVACARLRLTARIRLVVSDSVPAMLRLHGDRNSLLAALAAHWADQQLQIPQPLRPQPLPGGDPVARSGWRTRGSGGLERR